MVINHEELDRKGFETFSLSLESEVQKLKIYAIPLQISKELPDITPNVLTKNNTKNSSLFPNMPNDICLNILKKLDDMNLIVMASLSNGFNRFVDENKNNLFSARILKIKNIYNNILYLFGSLENYEKFPKNRKLVDCDTSRILHKSFNFDLPQGFVRNSTINNELFGMYINDIFTTFSLSSPWAVKTIKANLPMSLKISKSFEDVKSSISRNITKLF
jgi:F-box associated protein